MVIVLIDPAPEDVNESIKVDRDVDRMFEDNFKGSMPGIGVATLLNMGGNSIVSKVSTLRPDESKVETDTSLRATAAAAGVVRPLAEQRTTASVPNWEAVNTKVSEEAMLSKTALETKTGVTLLTKQLATMVVPEKPYTPFKTMDVTKAETEKPVNSTLKTV
jgi:hypothetical protein